MVVLAGKLWVSPNELNERTEVWSFWCRACYRNRLSSGGQCFRGHGTRSLTTNQSWAGWGAGWGWGWVKYFTFSPRWGEIDFIVFLPDVYEISIQAKFIIYSLTPVDILVGRIGMCWKPVQVDLVAKFRPWKSVKIYRGTYILRGKL